MLIVGSLGGLLACDEYSAEERYENVAFAEAQHSVLALDFTGQWCVNCPSATATLETTLSNGCPLVVVSVFLPYLVDVPSMNLHCADGLTIAQSLGVDVSSAPWLVADLDKSTLCSDYAQWPAILCSRAEGVGASISTSVSYDSEKKIATLQCLVDTMQTNCRLLFFLTEDSVCAPQMMSANVVDNEHIHNNVLRRLLTPMCGVELGGNTYLAEFDVADNWLVEHLNLISVLTDNSGRAIQSTKTNFK